MKFLLDTHLLVWAAEENVRLPLEARLLIDDPNNEPAFSAASLWEIAIKSALRRESFGVQPRVLREELMSNGYSEIPITSHHAISIDALPLLHGDPFDRLLLAQAITEGITLLTVDEQLARYPGPVRKV